MASLPFGDAASNLDIDLTDLDGTWERIAALVQDRAQYRRPELLSVLDGDESLRKLRLELIFSGDPILSTVLAGMFARALKCVRDGDDPSVWHPLLFVDQRGARLGFSRDMRSPNGGPITWTDNPVMWN